MGFFERLRQFMTGRYGFDALNSFIAVIAMLVCIANAFIWNPLASWILFAVEAGLIALIFFRALSRNINRRALENRRFRSYFDPVKNWVTLQVRKIWERKDFRYLKCPHCKAQLRVKNQKGEHGVRCPKCGQEFRVEI